MRIQTLIAAVVTTLLMGALLTIGTSPANAFINDCQTSPDGGAVGCLNAGGSGSDSISATDQKCDARGPRTYYRIGSGSWTSYGNSGGCGTTAIRTLTKMRIGTLVSYYVCNTNTNTGYRSCSGTRTVSVR